MDGITLSNEASTFHFSPSFEAEAGDSASELALNIFSGSEGSESVDFAREAVVLLSGEDLEYIEIENDLIDTIAALEEGEEMRANEVAEECEEEAVEDNGDCQGSPTTCDAGGDGAHDGNGNAPKDCEDVFLID